MREKQIEKKLMIHTHLMGGLCLKLTSPSMIGLPDRLILLPNGKSGFVEVKAPHKNPRVIQVKRMKQLQDLGFHCFVLDSVDDIRRILDAIQTISLPTICD